MTQQYEYHEIANLFPIMTPEEMAELQADIKANGLKQYITLYKGKVLDGRNRYTACLAVSVEPKFIEYTGDTPVAHVISLNLKRRQLTAGQKAILAVEMLPFVETEREKNRGKRNLEGKLPPKSAEQVAKALHISDKSVKFVKKLKKESPEIYEKVKKGGYSVEDAKRNLKQTKNTAYHAKEEAKKDTSKITVMPTDCILHNCDILDAPIADNSLNAVISDPPYPREYLECWKKLAQFASKKLKDGGILLAMSGQSYLPEVFENMKCEGLKYYWTLCLNQPKIPTILQTKRLNCFWKPILVFVKGEYTDTFQPTDVYHSDYKDTKEGKEYHEWGQNYEVFSKLITDWTYAGDTVCDPFLGGGTTGVAALSNKRKFIGIEINTPTFNTAKERIMNGKY